MSQPNLLDIDADELFKTYFIGEIDQVQKKLHYEIERKKEDLRAMVGEKYRDLIQAADTIEEMKDTIGSTRSHIEDIMVACKKLHESNLSSFKIETKSSVHQKFKTSELNAEQSIATQVKLLMEIPEKIWTCIDKQDFIKATQLFIMARHVNTGLQLQIGGKNVYRGYESLQRLVTQQWNTILNFNQTIINLCKEKLQDVDIGVETACSCLVSLYLLDSQSMSELLDTLIGLTSNSSLKSTLSFHLTKIIDGDIKAKIKEKILNGVKIVLKTVVLVYTCFVESNGGAVLAKLNQLYLKKSQPLIELVQFSDPNALKLLPSVITNYKLSTNKEVQPLKQSEITNCVQKWSEWVKEYISSNVKSLLQNITRVKVLHEIREDAFKIETPQNWSSICKSLGTTEVHVWCHYFQPLLTDRVQLIIESRWTKLYDGFKTQMLIDLTKVGSETEPEKEADINWFVWRDLIGETDIESRADVVRVMAVLMKDMWLQDRGFTPTLEKLIRTLDGELQKLIEDLKVYLDSEKKAKDKLYAYNSYEDIGDDNDQMYSDKQIVQDYLKDVSDRNVKSILQYIRACFEEQTLQSNELQKKTTAVYTARFVQAIVNLMPHLHKCYVNDDYYSSNIPADTQSSTRWNALCALLKENCLYCWSKWVDIAMLNIEDLTKTLPQTFSIEANIDYLMMQWDITKIEEKDEEGKVIETSIKIPAGPSLKLQQYLYSASRVLDEVVPHTLPAEIHSDYTSKLADVTLAHYNTVIRESEKDINQRCALQLLMDVRHLTLLLVPRENKKQMDFSQEICEFLRQKIDPFDYDVFYPYIQANLKRSVQRVQTLLGSLVLHHGQLSSVVGRGGGAAGGAGGQLAAAPLQDRPWFSLLPIAAPLTRKAQLEQQKKKTPIAASPNKATNRSSDISDLMSNSLPINFANARSGAASFFNSMTSDWFSGS